MVAGERVGRLRKPALGLALFLALLIAVPAPVNAGVVAATREVSVSSRGADGNDASELVAVSPGGRYVLFDSKASNLVPHDTNHAQDVFLRDTVKGTTIRVSVGYRGQQANGPSSGGSLSPNGRYVAFTSRATNLSRHADTNRVADAFLRIRRPGHHTTVRASVNSQGEQLKFGGFDALSTPDGRYIVFATDRYPSQDTLPVLVRDRKLKRTRRITKRTDSDVPFGISADGRYVGLEVLDDHLACWDVDIRDRAASKTISAASSVAVGWPFLTLSPPAAMTPDGRYVVISGYDQTPTDTYPTIRWRRGASTADHVNISPPSDATQVGNISDDGRYVAIRAGRYSYRVDMTNNSFIPVTFNSAGAQITGIGLLSGDAHWFAFTKHGHGVTPGDTDTSDDVFIRGPLP